MGTQPESSSFWSKWNGTAWSVVIHGVLMVAIVGFLRMPVKLAVYRLPGTRDGLQSLTYYTLGSVQATQNDIKATAKQKLASVKHSPMAAPRIDTASAASSERGAGGLGQSGLGDGDITIALEKYFPHPTPSLSALPPGFVGDVILDAVIDEHGKVAQLTLLHGVGAPIDEEVMQIVNQWTYVPAMKNGIAVASVQELHFHYERRG